MPYFIRNRRRSSRQEPDQQHDAEQALWIAGDFRGDGAIVDEVFVQQAGQYRQDGCEAERGGGPGVHPAGDGPEEDAKPSKRHVNAHSIAKGKSHERLRASLNADSIRS